MEEPKTIQETKETDNKNIDLISSEIREDISSIKQELDTMINKSELWKRKKVIIQIEKNKDKFWKNYETKRRG